MRVRFGLLALLYVFASSAQAEGPSDLIRRLGSSKFAEREEAARALEQLGAKALPALADAQKHPDFEVRQRAKRLHDKIQDRLEVARLLQPSRLKLHFKDIFLHDALREWHKHTGVPALLSDHLAKGNPRVTWKSEEPFWRAWSDFCDKAGLTEAIDVPTHLRSLKVEPGRVFLHLAAEDARLKLGQDLGVLHLLERVEQPIAADLSRSIRFRGILCPARRFEDRRKIALLQDQVFLLLEICPEPAVPWSVLENTRIDRVLDGDNRSLSLPKPNPSSTRPGLTRKEETAARIDLSRKLHTEVQAILLPRSPAEKPFREIQGSVSARLITRPTKFVVNNVLKSAGQSRHAGDAALHLIEAEVQDDGDLFVRVHLENFKALVQDHPGPRLIRPRPGFVAERGPADLAADAFELRDAAGRLLSCAEVRQKALDHENAVELQFTFRGSGNEAQPLTLSFAAYRAVSVEVPFTLRDLPLP